jgi:hypothetical protein
VGGRADRPGQRRPRARAASRVSPGDDDRLGKRNERVKKK